MTLKRDEIKNILELKAPLCLDCPLKETNKPVCRGCQLDHIFTAFNEALKHKYPA